MAKQSKKVKKRSPKLYKWQILTTQSPEWEREWVNSLTIGLEQSQTIQELIAGLTIWLSQVAKMERERQGRSRIILPGGSLN